ncbi:MAG: RNA methyltransferase [Bacteroidia bacterium]|nr:RNA methyltransferase [Bacteroidia bacterium]MCZ2247557.1 RNA methyltransferase [Bacteroidia bacterium]
MRKLSNSELLRKSPDEFKQAQKTPVVLVLDNVRSLNNVGSVFRTADSFLLEAVYLCGITGTPPHKDIQKTALGATATVNWKYYKTTEEAVEELQTHKYQVFAIEQAEGSEMLHQLQFNFLQKIAFVFGNEISGVSQSVINLCHSCIEIPQSGFKHSLNISVATGIVCWEAYRQFLLWQNSI